MDLSFLWFTKSFIKNVKLRIPKKLIGTDLFSNDNELKEGALELLKDDNAKNLLSDKDFVFMMHQGYMFWYFRANGNENPSVYYYQEQSLVPDKKEDQKNFLKNLT